MSVGAFSRPEGSHIPGREENIHICSETPLLLSPTPSWCKGKTNPEAGLKISGRWALPVSFSESTERVAVVPIERPWPAGEMWQASACFTDYTIIGILYIGLNSTLYTPWGVGSSFLKESCIPGNWFYIYTHSYKAIPIWRTGSVSTGRAVSVVQFHASRCSVSCSPAMWLLRLLPQGPLTSPWCSH